MQLRLPGEDWRERHGAAGVQADKRRNSPIVELSLLLVSPGRRSSSSSSYLSPGLLGAHQSVCMGPEQCRVAACMHS